MKTEQELKRQCTPGIIKKMAEFAEGFDTEDSIYSDSIYIMFKSLPSGGLYLSGFIGTLFFPILIHRAAEGWNQIQASGHSWIKISSYDIECHKDTMKGINGDCYLFHEYQKESLTQLECALLDCMIEILKEKS
jgi:hypothetical protein